MPSEETTTSSEKPMEQEEEKPLAPFQSLKILYHELPFPKFLVLIHRITRRLKPQPYCALWVALCFLALLGLGILFNLLMMIRLLQDTLSPPESVLIGIILIPFPTLFVLVAISAIERPIRSAIYAELTQSGRCPVCAYQIIDHNLDEMDEQLTCPECGWNRPLAQLGK